MAKILALSVPERILAVEQHAELERRLEAFDAEPGVGSSWATVRRRVEKRSRK